MTKQNKIHERALRVVNTYLTAEVDLVDILSEVELGQLHREVDMKSMFLYATEFLGLSEATAYTCIALSRKSRAVPELGRVLRERQLPIFKAAKIVSVITRENCAEVLDFAVKNSTRKIEAEVARRNPKSVPDKIKPIADGFVQMTLTVSAEAAKNFERVQSLLARKASRAGDCFEILVNQFLEKNDPVKRAERITAKKLFTGRASNTLSGKSSERHAVNLRDQGRCQICESDRFTEIHHIQPRHLGGADVADNLMTLCSYHHRQAHQN